jgi:hypothetical protein
MISIERWIEVRDFPKYLVSNYGRIANQKTGFVLNPTQNGQGYLVVSLFNEYGVKHLYVHRVVALSFFDILLEDFEINHLNGIKSDCAIWNLEVVTPSENMYHAYQIGLRQPTKCRTSRSVRIIETGEVFESIRSCAKAIGENLSSVHRWITRGGSSSMGYTFEYVEVA